MPCIFVAPRKWSTNVNILVLLLSFEALDQLIDYFAGCDSLLHRLPLDPLACFDAHPVGHMIRILCTHSVIFAANILKIKSPALSQRRAWGRYGEKSGKSYQLTRLYDSPTPTYGRHSGCLSIVTPAPTWMPMPQRVLRVTVVVLSFVMIFVCSYISMRSRFGR